MWETVSVAIPLIFCVVILFNSRLRRSESALARNALIVLIAAGLVALVFWPSRGAGFSTYTQAAALIVSDGARVYSVYPTPPQPETPPAGLIVLAGLYAVTPQEYWILVVGLYQAILDGVIAYFTYKSLGGNLGLLGACLVIFNPFFFAYSILNLSPDQLMLAIYMFGAYLISRQKLTPSYLVFGLAFMTMQTAIFFLAGIFFLLIFRYGWREVLKFSVIVSGVFLIISLPFLLVDNSYMDHVWLGEFVRVTVGAGEHLYSPDFAGLSTYLAYIHQYAGVDLKWAYALGPLVFALIIASVVYLTYKRKNIGMSHLSYLSLMPLYLATWNTAYGADPVNPWRLYYFIPFATIIWLTNKGAVGYASLAMILAVQFYRAADYAAFLFNVATEPLLLPGNLVVPAAFLVLYVLILSKRSPEDSKLPQ